MMRILSLTQVLPYPLDAGPKVRAYHVLQHLAAQHQVTLVSFGRESDSPEALAHLRKLFRDVHVVPMRRPRAAEVYALGRSLLTREPFTILRDERAEMYQKLGEVIAGHSFDAVHADQLAMAQYALWVQKAAPWARPKMVLDAHNAYYLIPQRLAEVASLPAQAFLRREARLVARYEADVYRRFDYVLTVTEQDLASIKQLSTFNGGSPQFMTIPICVDASTPRLERQPGARGLLMLGGLHWPPNADGTRWFAREIWPLVKALVPEAQLFIVGARPPRDIRALGDFVGIERPEQAGDAPVVITGYVQDPQAFIRASATLIVALRSGGGMRVKIVEALQWGLPVVSTTIGCEGIHVTPGQDMLVADDPQAFAQSVVSVLQNRGLAQRLADNGRRLVEREYDWRKAYTALDAIYTVNAHVE